MINANVVAVMIEPIQGEAGVWPATPEFLRELRSLTERRGVLLIFDEIQTGVGRTGALFDYQNAGVEPDILTLGKGIGGGVPLAALLAKKSASYFEYGDQGGTYCGNPLMCAAGDAVLRAVDQPAFLSRVNEAGALLANELRRLSLRYDLGDVRGRGLLLALDLKTPCGPDIVAEAFRRGLLLNAPQPDALRFMPALNVTDAEIRLHDRVASRDPRRSRRRRARFDQARVTMTRRTDENAGPWPAFSTSHCFKPIRPRR